jgi:hypothetical protein
MNAAETSGCPSQFALDDQALHGGGSAVTAHVQTCARCQAIMAERAAHLARFHDGSATLWTRIAANGQERRRRRRWRRVFVQLPALVAGLGAVALLIVGARPFHRSAPSSYVAPKGGAPVEIVCRRGETSFVLAPGDEVAPGDSLRFRPLPVWPDARLIHIGSVDGTGRYTPFYPSAAGATSVAIPDRGQPLEGSITLDAAPGPERLFVVLSATPVRETDVRHVAESRAATGATVDRIDGAPVLSRWIVLRKRAGAPTTP